MPGPRAKRGPQQERLLDCGGNPDCAREHRFGLLAKLAESTVPSPTRFAGLTPNNPDGAEAALFRANIPESLQISLRGNVAKAGPLVAGNDLFDKLSCLFVAPVVLMPICESIENAERSG